MEARKVMRFNTERAAEWSTRMFLNPGDKFAVGAKFGITEEFKVEVLDWIHAAHLTVEVL